MLDYLLIGGGLANGLLALQLAARQPRARVLIVDRSPVLGDGHTWSFHARDVSASTLGLLAPAIASSLPGTEVRFATLERLIAGDYHVITSPKFDQSVRSVADVRLAEVTSVSPHHVTLRDGRTLEAARVIDARGPERASAGVAGYQKFLGLELRLAHPHGRTVATLMDAGPDIDQVDGFRFVYVLPLSADTLLVEDTYYSDDPTLDSATLRDRVLGYAAARGLDVAEVLREERGVLPLPYAPPEPPPPTRGLVVTGYQGGFIHPTTGYSLPVAARVAERLAATPATADFPDAAWTAFVAAHRRQTRFAAYLNRLLFFACAPAERWSVLARFYSLPDDTIARFYALDTRATDRLRILCGRRPPGVTYLGALGALALQRPGPTPGRDA